MDVGHGEPQQEKHSEEMSHFQNERQKIIQPTSLKDPKLQKLKEILTDWINSSLKLEHIVVKSLEDDLFDGLVLHHLLCKFGGVHLSVEEIALTNEAQIHKLVIILEAMNKRLGLRGNILPKWSVKLIHNKDFIATLHLLVAMVKCFQPDLELPLNVSVEVIFLEIDKNGIKSEKQIEFITEQSNSRVKSPEESNSGCDLIDELLKLESHKVNTVKKAILHFVNKNLSPLGIQVADIEKQFADGVILLLLIGQLEDYFIPLYEFNLSPVTSSEMLQNVTLALDLLNGNELQVSNADPQDIVSQDVTATLRVLYSLFKKHKNK